jgi:hypothetical protein
MVYKHNSCTMYHESRKLRKLPGLQLGLSVLLNLFTNSRQNSNHGGNIKIFRLKECFSESQIFQDYILELLNYQTVSMFNISTYFSHTIGKDVGHVITDHLHEAKCISVLFICLPTEPSDKVTGQRHICT